jgi:hypothetical protein
MAAQGRRGRGLGTRFTCVIDCVRLCQNVKTGTTARMPSHIALQCADASLLPCSRRGGVLGDAGGIEPVSLDLCAPTTHAPDGARPRGERKDPLDTCRAQVASATAAPAAAAAASLAAWASSRRLRLHIRRTSTARARTQRHRSVLRARAGLTWEGSPSAARSVALASRRAAGTLYAMPSMVYRGAEQ